MIVNITKRFGASGNGYPISNSMKKVMQTMPFCWEMTKDSIYVVGLNLQRLYYEEPEKYKNNWHPRENVRSKEEIPIKERKSRWGKRKKGWEGGKEETRKKVALKRWYWKVIKLHPDRWWGG